MFSSRAVAAASRVAIVVVAAVIIALGFLGVGVAWLAENAAAAPRRPGDPPILIGSAKRAP